MGSRNGSFIESLPVMLQGTLLLLACGFCQHMWPINASAASDSLASKLDLTYNGDRGHVCVPTPNTSTGCTSRSLEEGPAYSYLLCHPLQTGTSVGPANGSPAALPSPFSTNYPTRDTQLQRPRPWLEPRDPKIIHEMNTNDVGSVSWILKGTADLEALDTTIRLTGTILWSITGSILTLTPMI